eukprot:m.4832 g.4832  ORF g.4832 m.4832 type:complete len:204 (-) comp2297_c0_seq1:449-1060(-)
MSLKFVGALVVLLVACGAAILTSAIPTLRFHKEPMLTQLKLGAFSYTNCGKSDAAQITSLSISPDPIELPGNITFSMAAMLGAQVAAPIKLELTLEKKVGVWVKIPCVDDIGSCTYPDVCTLLEKIPLQNGKCPAPLPSLGIPCRCPLSTFKVNVPPTTVEAPKLPPSVPSWLSNGDYKATFKAYTNAGTELLCSEIEISLKA